MITLYAVRHGETDYNRANRVQGHKDSVLTEFGHAQARALANRFAGERIDRLYTSPLVRARTTAEAIAAEAGIEEVIPLPGFLELNCGTFEDMLIDDIKETRWDEWQNFLANPEVRPEGGESMNDLALRVGRTLDKVLADAGEDDTIVIVSHAGVVRMTLAHLLNVSVAAAVNFGLSNASIARFINKYGRWTCLKWNDTEHLGELEGEVKFVL